MTVVKIGKQDPATPIPEHLRGLAVFQSYASSKYLSLKHSSYFQVYEELLAPFRGRAITFVEIGVLNGGSLFMWRDFFGPEVRIIGVDFNPGAKKWQSEGFEIHIGDQSDILFWERFFADVGDVDVVLDDGGHTNEQQIVTTLQCVPRIRDGGLLLVEDVHTSYMKELGNPSRYSFINYAKRLVDGVNARFPNLALRGQALNRAIYSIGFYESIVCFRIDRRKCFVSSPTSNNALSVSAEDYRYRDSSFGYFFALRERLAVRFASLKRIPSIRLAVRFVVGNVLGAQAKIRGLRMRKYFR
jgi:hypothetical protein